MESYGKFAAVYDRLMDDFEYPGWAEYYLRLLEKAGCKPRRMCDCACGTGSMSVEFARRGIQVTGVDLSEEMLEEAAVKARRQAQKIAFVRQNMTALTLPRPVDAIVCACDGVNYLASPGDLSAAACWPLTYPPGTNWRRSSATDFSGKSGTKWRIYGATA